MKAPSFERSFASHPKAKYWSKTKNGDVTPRDVFKSSARKCCFDCGECPHTFESSLCHIVNGKWCPYCCVSSSKLCPNTNNCDVCFKKSFASHPNSKYWSKTNGKTPRDVFKNSATKYGFGCGECHHVFESSPNSIVSGGSWCPYCANQKLCPNTNCDACFKKSFASHPNAKYWSDTNVKTPRDVFKSSGTKYGFDCNKCHHVFESRLYNVVNGYWCPYCANKQLCDITNNCDACFKKSFALHPKAKYWSKTKNGDVTPRDVFKRSRTKYGFDCDKCPHAFESSPDYIVGMGSWCPYCCVPSKKLCDNANCDACFKKSFASHSKAKYWSNTNVKTPRDVFKNSATKCCFDCNKCPHPFESPPASIVGMGSWCPYCCVPSKKLCDNANCDACFKRSFASHPKVKCWSKTNGKTPRDVFKNSAQKYCFDCDKCHQAFESPPDAIVGQGRWCPKCKNKTELKLYEAVKRHYPTLIHQFKQEWCKNIMCLPFDFCIPEHNIIIELDGPQHFMQVSNWKSPEETNENDLFKEKCANEQCYSVIRIIQEDVFGDKYDWLSKLQTEIENIINDNTIIHNIYMCENGEYDMFINE